MKYVEFEKQKEMLNKEISKNLNQPFVTEEILYSDKGLHIHGYVGSGILKELKKFVISYKTYDAIVANEMH